jgi:hypothetical protein
MGIDQGYYRCEKDLNNKVYKKTNGVFFNKTAKLLVLS